MAYPGPFVQVGRGTEVVEAAIPDNGRAGQLGEKGRKYFHDRFNTYENAWLNYDERASEINVAV